MQQCPVKYEGWGFNATDKLAPEQRRQQDYRALCERAERISAATDRPPRRGQLQFACHGRGG
jgi:hypothetical protein